MPVPVTYGNRIGWFNSVYIPATYKKRVFFYLWGTEFYRGEVLFLGCQTGSFREPHSVIDFKYLAYVKKACLAVREPNFRVLPRCRLGRGFRRALWCRC